MKVVQTTTDRVHFTEDDGTAIATLEVTKIPGITNGYAVSLTLAAGEGADREYQYTAASLSRLGEPPSEE